MGQRERRFPRRSGKLRIGESIEEAGEHEGILDGALHHLGASEAAALSVGLESEAQLHCL
jgi:hypothetical protein